MGNWWSLMGKYHLGNDFATSWSHYKSVLPQGSWRAYNPTPTRRSLKHCGTGTVALWHWEGARNLPQAPQLVFFSVSCGEIQIILLATGHAVWISDLTTVNQEVIGSVGQPPIHDFPWNCCLSSGTLGFLAPCFSSALSSGKYKSLALLCAVAVTCNSVCCIFSRLVPSILERCAAWMQKNLRHPVLKWLVESIIPRKLCAPTALMGASWFDRSGAVTGRV